MTSVARTIAAGAAILAASMLLARRRDTDVTRDRSHVSRTVTIQANGTSLLEYFSNPGQLPAFFHGLSAAQSLDATHQRWTFARHSGRPIPIEIEIVDHVPGTRYAWRTSKARGYAGGGSVTASPAPGKRGTQVRFALHVDGRGARAHTALERLFGMSPGQIAMESLRNLKALAETGERPTGARS